MLTIILTAIGTGATTELQTEHPSDALWLQKLYGQNIAPEAAELIDDLLAITTRKKAIQGENRRLLQALRTALRESSKGIRMTISQEPKQEPKPNAD